MNTQDILNIFLILGLFIITACIVYTTYYFVSALKSMTALTDDLDQITQGVKNKIQMKALVAIPALLLTLISKVIRKKRG